ncbi:class I SAM-dependent DNA methyltransferase [Trichococcus sp. K1Tr]|uniref:class I SAM-dependent DNA methyltransferase n=1 Tax=Trichococcus sp. K1Tr TaxID=3020847 RepID=UPI00232E1BC2|nr:class I SAM-dependent DNA methyltransferase [Trichococcus sp. K1Tr]MDB6353647.1 class I SAM-dependent DNA methyltransferase [Trichococcus sp. K1Tr]
MASAALGIEEKLWLMADKLRGSMDSSEYKNVVLGLLFLKYISDAFEEKHQELLQDEYADEEDRDEYLADNIFWVPKEARWGYINRNSKKPEIGQIIDHAMLMIEKENPALKNVLPKTYSRYDLDKTLLGELIDQFTFKVGDTTSQEQDILGRVYEYFLSKFASAEGKGGGEFYTPRNVVQLLVEMLEPYSGRVYDPCCGSGGMFIQSEKFVKEHQGNIGNLSIYGQESNPTTWKLAKMNLAIRGIDGDLGPNNGDTFHNDLHNGLKADYILANPPFNIKDWGGERLTDDKRWKYGVPPTGNANYAWIQHMVSKLAPSGTAGFVLANGSMSTNTSAELEIRKKLIEDDIVECIVTLPGQLFYSTQIPVCLWFVTKNKERQGRKGEILFIDARQKGAMVDRTHKEFSDEDINEITSIFHAWRGTNEEIYENIAGFCKTANLEEVQKYDYILTPGRYVGLEDAEEDVEPFDEKMTRLKEELAELFNQSHHLEGDIKKRLEAIGYGF